MEISKVLCLMTSVRGGSKLFHYLLDSHPQIICFPRTLKFEEFWYLIEGKNKSINSIADIFIDQYPRFFDGKIWSKYNILDKADKLGEGFNETFKVDKNKFKNYFFELSKNEIDKSRKNVFINIHLAYHKASGKNYINNSIILYHIHAVKNINSLRFCINDFGIKKTKLVFMTKHPLLGMRSILKWMDNIKIPLPQRPSTLYYYQNEVYLGLNEIERDFPNLDIKILLLERLINNKSRLINNFIQWINIQWNDCLLIPTIHGKLWWGNAKDPKKGIDKDIESFYPKGFLETKDLDIINNLFQSRMKEYGFSNAPYKKTLLNIFKVKFFALLPTFYEWELLKKLFKGNTGFMVRWSYYYVKRILLTISYSNNVKKLNIYQTRLL